MTAKDLGAAGKDIYYGYGLIDFSKALNKPRLKASLTKVNNKKTNLVICEFWHF